MPPFDRYSRQTILPIITLAGQQKLKDSTVLVMGCGALGSFGAELLARAGVGRLILADRDILELHNLQRQTLYTEEDVRQRLPKAEAAAKHLRAINSQIMTASIVTDATATNVEQLIQPVDVVLDGTDNFETRYLLNDACVKEGKPFVYGGVLGTLGTVLTIRPGAGPCLRCVYSEPPNPEGLPTCETHGVLNTAVAWVASLEATETLKILLGEPVSEKPLYSLDIWKGSVHAAPAKRSSTCPCCGLGKYEFLDSTRGSSSTVFCGRNAVQVTPEKRHTPDFDLLAKRLSPLGKITANGMILEFEVSDKRMVIFPDGRVLVMGTQDPAEARTLVAKYIGA
jgi:adenylyltransferase/sulfurtransferase